MKKYTTRHEEKRRYMITFIVILLAIIGGMAWRACEAEKPDWDVCYEMCNKHIEWSWAGKN